MRRQQLLPAVSVLAVLLLIIFTCCDPSLAQAPESQDSEPPDTATADPETADPETADPETADPETPAPDPWSALHFESIVTEGCTIRLDPKLSDHRDAIVERIGVLVAEARAQAATAREIRAQMPVFIEHIDAITGCDPSPEEETERELVQRNVFRMSAIDIAEGASLTLVASLRDTIRENLLQGGKIPGFELNLETGGVTWRLQHATRGSADELQGVAVTELPFVIKDPAEIEGFEMPAIFGTNGLMALQAAASWTIQHQIGSDPRLRWFRSGLAWAFALDHVRELGLESAVELSFTALDTTPFADRLTEIELRTWPSMELAFEEWADGFGPIPGETALLNARNAYAHLEVRRIIDEQGPEAMRSIFDAAHATLPTSPDQLRTIIRDVTGEDVDARLDRYQGFSTLEEGAAVHRVAALRAEIVGDYERATGELARSFEIQYSLNRPWSTSHLPELLVRAGHTADGLALLERQISILEEIWGADPAQLRAEFCRLAIAGDELPRAYAMADAVLGVDPQNLDARIVRAHRWSSLGNTQGATALIEEILERASELVAPQYRALAALEPRSDQDFWATLEMERIELDGGVLLFEKSLDEHREFFIEDARTFLEALGMHLEAFRDPELVDRTIESVNAILGFEPDAIAAESQRFHVLAVIRGFTSNAAVTPTIRIARESVIREWLESGRSVPLHQFLESDERLQVYMTPQRIIGWDRVITLPDQRSYAHPFSGNKVLASKDALAASFGASFSEMIIAQSFTQVAQPNLPSWRWFAEGFTPLLLRELDVRMGRDVSWYVDPESRFEEYAPLVGGANLRYWMVAPNSIHVPIDEERRLDEARSVFAQLEAKHVIDEAGIECVPAILRKVSEFPARGGAEFEAAIQEVTGIDIQTRLAAYEEFESPDEGMAGYSRAIRDARETRDHASALRAVLRFHEIRSRAERDLFPQFHVLAAEILRERGEPRAGFGVLQRMADRLGPISMEFRLRFLPTLVDYAIQCGEPGWAYAATEELIGSGGSTPSTILISVHRHIVEGELDEARRLASLLEGRQLTAPNRALLEDLRQKLPPTD